MQTSKLRSKMAILLFTFIMQLMVACFYGSIANAAEIGRTNDSAALKLTNAKEDLSYVDPDIAVLDNIGQVALKMVEHIAAAEDEKVEMNLLSEFVQALSRAAIMMEHPQIPQLEEMKAEFNSFKEQMVEEKKKLTDQIALLGQRLARSDAKNKMLERKVNESASTLQNLIALTNERKLGFMASSTTNQGLSSGTIVKFDRIQLNEGNHYDPALGIFTCPLTGLYLMSVTITAYSTNHINVYLTVDGTHQLHLYSYGSSNHNYNSVSQTGLVKCNAGSKIWALANGSGTTWGGHYTSFSGLLYETLQPSEN